MDIQLFFSFVRFHSYSQGYMHTNEILISFRVIIFVTKTIATNPVICGLGIKKCDD